MVEAALGIAGAAVGLCLGSFVATAAVRQVRSEPAIFGRSHCDDCGVGLSFAQTVPVVSYVRSRGACHSCGARIDPVHLAGEICGAAVVALSFALLPLPQAGLVAALGIALLASGIVDLKAKTLPDMLTFAMTALAISLEWLRSLEALWIGLVAAAVAFAVLEIIRRLFLKVRRKPGLGFGDVKLLSALAIWLGLATPMAVALAAALGLGAFAIAKPRHERIPFGPFIALAAWSLGLAMEVTKWPSLA